MMRSVMLASRTVNSWKVGLCWLALMPASFNQIPAQNLNTIPSVSKSNSSQPSNSQPPAIVSAAQEVPKTTPTPLQWQADYPTAIQVATTEKKLVLVIFTNATAERSIIPGIEKQLADPKNTQAVARHILVKVPTTATITVNGRESRLLSHPAFSELHGSAGLAVIDYAHPGTEHYKLVVNQLPFSSGKFYRFSASHLPTLLTLPPGTLTQRSMIFAVRIHPEGPQSCCGSKNPILTEEAASHSRQQASLGRQGHHNWDTRFHRIRSRLLPFGGQGMPREVVAESWPNQNLMDSCVDCVASWRHSDGHWSAVRAQQNQYAYDIYRGSNGIWYGTGIFSN